MNYPDGQLIQVGDGVLLDNGAFPGEVVQIVDTPDAKREIGLKPDDADCVLVKRAGKHIVCLPSEGITQDSIQFLVRAAK